MITCKTLVLGGFPILPFLVPPFDCGSFCLVHVSPSGLTLVLIVSLVFEDSSAYVCFIHFYLGFKLLWLCVLHSCYDDCLR